MEFAPSNGLTDAMTNLLTSTNSPQDSSLPTVSVVVPTYKEAENIDELVRRVSDTLEEVETLFEIIIVDDASHDGTAREVERLQREGHPVRLIERTDERGLSSAVLRGFHEARGDFLVCMDADLSHPPEALPQVLNAFRTSVDTEMVVGSRYVRGGTTDEKWGLFRRLNSRVATWLARPFTRIQDPMAGFFAVPRQVFQRTVAWDPVGYKIGLEILVKTGCRKVAEVPIHFADRKRGQSKLSFKEQCNYLRHLLRLGQFKFRGTYQFLQFAAVGASGVLVDLSFFTLLLTIGLGIPMARALAIGLAICWNFVGNELWTFRSTPGSVWARFQKFVLACSFGAVASYGITLLGCEAFDYFQEHPLPIAAIGIAVGTASNFLLAKNWVFRYRTTQSA
jgi:dolichol-phosphate mannosyltransferase